MTALTRIEAVALRYLSECGEMPSVAQSSVSGGIVVLRADDGRTLAEVCDGLQVALGSPAGIDMALVEPFRLRVRCHACPRSTVRDSATWVCGEVWECRCGSRNVLPGDPVKASRG